MSDFVECSICLEFYSAEPNDRFVSTVPCGHLFHERCVTRVFAGVGRVRECPYCREPIPVQGGLLTLHGIIPTRSEKKFKVVVLGDSGAGKTSLARRFCEGVFDVAQLSTIGQDLWTRALQVGDETVKLSIWDTGGQEQFRAVTPQYIRKSQAVIIAYDLMCIKTFENVPEWFAFANRYAPHAVKVLVGTKSDLRRCMLCGDGRSCTVPTKVGKEQMAERLGLLAYETSSATDTNVDIAFRAMIGQILQNRDLVRESRLDHLPRNNGELVLRTRGRTGTRQTAGRRPQSPAPAASGCC